MHPHVNLNNPGDFPKSRDWSTEWLFVYIVINRTPQSMHHEPGRTLYHMVAIGKKLESSWTIFALSLYLYPLTWPMYPPSMQNTRWWYSLPGSEDKDTLVFIPVGLDADLGHYVSHPITLYPPYHHFLLYPTISPSPHRLHPSLPPSSKSYPSAPSW